MKKFAIEYRITGFLLLTSQNGIFYVDAQDEKEALNEALHKINNLLGFGSRIRYIKII